MPQNQFIYDKEKEACQVAFADSTWMEVAEPPLTSSALDISRTVFSQFVGAHCPIDNTGVLPMMATGHGFDVIGRGIDRCAESYRGYVDENQQPYVTVEFLKALRHPQTVRFFTRISRMDDPTNKVHEIWFGLKEERNINEPEFLYEPDPGYFIASEDILDYVSDELRMFGRSVTGDHEPPRICPASQFIPKAWNIIVDACEQAGTFEPKEVTADQGMVE